MSSQTKTIAQIRSAAMGWVKEALKELEAGRTVKIRPSGGSMRGRIESGQLVTLAPVALYEISVEDVVLVRWQGNYLLHLVREIKDGNFLIGNNIGKINGWVSAEAICAKVTAVEAAHPGESEGGSGGSRNLSP